MAPNSDSTAPFKTAIGFLLNTIKKKKQLKPQQYGPTLILPLRLTFWTML